MLEDEVNTLKAQLNSSKDMHHFGILKGNNEELKVKLLECNDGVKENLFEKQCKEAKIKLIEAVKMNEELTILNDKVIFKFKIQPY